MTTDTDVVAPLSSIGPIKDRRNLSALCKEYREQSEIEGEAKAAKKTLKPQIAEIVERHGLTKVVGASWSLSQVTSVRTSISAKKLAELGVSMKTILAATVETPLTYFQVRGRSSDG